MFFIYLFLDWSWSLSLDAQRDFNDIVSFLPGFGGRITVFPEELHVCMWFHYFLSFFFTFSADSLGSLESFWREMFEDNEIPYEFKIYR